MNKLAGAILVGEIDAYNDLCSQACFAGAPLPATPRRAPVPGPGLQ